MIKCKEITANYFIADIRATLKSILLAYRLAGTIICFFKFFRCHTMILLLVGYGWWLVGSGLLIAILKS